MWDKIRPALIITQREVRDQLRDWRVIFPVVALTLFFPFLMNFTAGQILDFVNRYGADLVGARLIPFLMMVVGFFPMTVSLVIALESFVGERERMSIEPLLNSPLADWQLYLGKLLAATIAPLVTSYLGIFVYVIGLVANNTPLPPTELIFQILAITTVQAVLMVAGAIVVSTQSTSVRAANLLASFIIIPMALLIEGESLVMFYGDYSTLWWAVVGVILLSILLIRVGLAHFRREVLLGREIDKLNLRWGGRTFWNTFKGEAKSIKDWYLREIPRTLRGMKKPILILALLMIIGAIIGVMIAEQYPLPLNKVKVEGNIELSAQNIQDIFPLFSPVSFFKYLFRNLTTLLLSALLGMVSLGILGTLPVIGTAAVGGYLIAILGNYGLPVIPLFVGFILPHGVFELSAAILASAALLQAGAKLATPLSGKSVGEVWISGVATWFKVLIGIVLPLLIIAAAVEVWITPRIGLALLQ
jgi:uncharacterized membrane protein SpoIIM required for sporulation/ABC-type transport system involved in multi-copper enzyme maturation permease subunit